MNGPSDSTLLERIDGLDEARVVRVDEADLGHQQHAGVEVACRRSSRRRPAASRSTTARGSWRGSCRRGCARSPAFVTWPSTAAILASRSHAAQHISDDEVCTRARVRSSHIPASGWSWKRQACSPMPSSSAKSRSVGAPEQAMVEERLRRAEDDVAVHVVLEVLEGLVADPHRAHAAIAGQRRHQALGQRLARGRCRTAAGRGRRAALRTTSLSQRR